MIVKRLLTDRAVELFRQYPVITITGPRQSGKTTLAKLAFPDVPYINLEDMETRSFALEDPRGFLNSYPNGAIFDEIQNVPDLTSYIQVYVDKAGKESMYVLTGRRHFELMEKVSQSLAGRTALLKLLPFSCEEIRDAYARPGTDECLLKGFYPRIYDKGLEPTQALSDYYTTYVERDLRTISNIHNINLFHKFVRLCAGRAGQLLNLSSLANDTGISHSTAREWMALLQESYIVFLLEPFFRNIGTRLVKTPKLYFYDVGLASMLLGIESLVQVKTHPLRGNLFENMIVMELLKYRFNRVRMNNLSFFRNSRGNEIDCIYETAGRQALLEIKSAETVNADFFRGFDFFEKTTGAEALLKILAYAGERNEKRSGVYISDIWGLPHLLDGLDHSPAS